MIKRLSKFFNEGIWQLDISTYPKWKAALVRFVRIMVMAFKGFIEDKVQLHASALTFYSLLSIVPIFALLFAVAKGFGFERKLEQELIKTMEGHQDVMQQVVDFANSLLDNTKGGLIAGIGSVILLWSVMQVLSNIEKSFNDIWLLKKSRTWARKFTEYLSIMLVAPILVLVSSSVSVIISSSVQDISNSFEILSSIGPFILWLLSLLPYLLFSLLFTFIYMVMPNTKVNWKGALFAGIFAGIVFQITEYAFINFQFGVARYNAIYGSFSALPLFLVFLQVSWLIVLLGAEISFAYQNVNNYMQELDHREVDPESKRLVALLITQHVVQRFEKAEPPASAGEISSALKVPEQLIRLLADELTEMGLLTRTERNDDEDAYQPGLSTSHITVAYVLNALDKRGKSNLSLDDSAQLKAIRKRLEGLSAAVESAPDNVLLSQL